MNLPATHTASGLPWQLRCPDERLVLAMAQQHGIPELLASILAGRGVALDQVPRFLAPSLRDDLPDPFHLRDMDKAAARLARAITSGERVAVFGDYDVDGATSSALLHHYFAQLGLPLTVYIPDRLKEGYGPTVAAFARLINPSPLKGEDGRGTEQGSAFQSPPPNLQGGGNGATLIITVDCGTLAHEPIAYAQARGVDVVVLDHHLSSGALPNAHAVVNPNRVDETSPHTNLAAVGVTFLVLVALSKTLRAQGFFSSPLKGEEGRATDRGSAFQRPPPNLPLQGGGIKEPNLMALLDMVALGTVCDVMPLTGLNRAYVAQGLKVMAQRGNAGLAALADASRFAEAPGVYHLGFLLGPRINAGGRVGEAGLGVELLTCAVAEEARAIATRLDQYNAERQAIETGVLEAAMVQAETQANAPVLLLHAEGWHPGVIGIVAGRIKEKFQRPTAVVAMEGGQGKGSARSVPGADFGAAVHAAHALGLIEGGGGHAMAAGFSLAAAQLPAFHAFLMQRMEAAVAAYNEARVKKFDGWISVPAATLGLLEELARGGPYGLGHPGPRFALRGARIVRFDTLKQKHIRVILSDETLGGRLAAMAFHAEGTPLGQWLKTMKNLHFLGELKRNHWQGQDSAQFIIDDVAKIA